MKGRVVVLSTAPRGAALIVDGVLQDVILAPLVPGQEVGDICVARVTRKLPTGGAFCALPDGADGYLRDAKRVRDGDLILAMVQSLPEPGKAVTLTTRLLFKGPRLILTPGAPGVNVSRRIGNEAERERLTEAVAGARDALTAHRSDLGGSGVIVRTEARGSEDTDLHGELAAAISRHAVALEALAGGKPSIQPLEVWRTGLPDWYAPEPDCVVMPTDHPIPEAGTALPWGNSTDGLHRLTESDPFAAFGVHEAMADLLRPVVELSQGSFAVQATRAMVAVDVDTGADFSPAAGLRANLAVMSDLPRQLRLRGLGGQIVIDPAPMPKQHRRTVEQALARSLRDDPVETQFVGWTPLGHMELRRKRERRPLSEGLSGGGHP